MRTGIFEYLRKCVFAITGKDPENEDSSQLYRFYSQSTGGQMGLPASGTTPFKHSVITPVQAPPGIYYDTTGKVTKPHIYDATMGDGIRVLPMHQTASGLAQGTATDRFWSNTPYLTLGASLNTSSNVPVQPNVWKWGMQSFPINAATDITLLPAVASTKYQVVSIACVPHSATADAKVAFTLTFTEDGSAAHGGSRVIAVDSFYKSAIGMSGGVSFPFMGSVWYTGTANKKGICTVNNVGQAGDTVDYHFAYRTYA